MEKQNILLDKTIKDSGLDEQKSLVITNHFKLFHDIASEWQQKAIKIVVSDENDKDNIKKAREGRLFLKGKRCDIEKLRKELKEQSLKEGKAIDGIARYLTGLIEPTEEYLESQEKYAELKEKERKDKLERERLNLLEPYNVNSVFYNLRDMPENEFQAVLKNSKINYEQELENKKKMELERIEKEKEDKRIREENEKLRKEKAIAEQKQKDLENEIAEANKKKELELLKTKEEEQRKLNAPDKDKILLFAEQLKSLSVENVNSDAAKNIVLNIEEMKFKFYNYIIKWSEYL